MDFGTSVLGANVAVYYQIITTYIMACGQKYSQLTAEQLMDIIALLKPVCTIPENGWVQLKLVFTSVYSQWFSNKAILFRHDVLGLPPNQGLAIGVQVTLLGNCGVCYSRNPFTGESVVVGEYHSPVGTMQTIEDLHLVRPDVVNLLREYATTLEKHFGDVQVTTTLIVLFDRIEDVDSLL